MYRHAVQYVSCGGRSYQTFADNVFVCHTTAEIIHKL